MRISELSQASGVPVPTIKYYLREGLLPPGERRAPNQATYGDFHVHRLRLIRVLIEVGGLDIAAVRSVLQAIEREDLSLHTVLGVAHHALGPSSAQGPVNAEVARAYEEVQGFLAELGWHVSPQAPARWMLADALAALRRLGWDTDVGAFFPYADAADKLAALELSRLPADRGRGELVEQAVVGTAVFEAALIALRRLAQEHHSASRWAGEAAHVSLEGTSTSQATQRG